MRLLARIRTTWRALFRTAQVTRELDDEVRFALDELTRRHVARGLAPDAAARAARRDLGRTDTMREEVVCRGIRYRVDAVRLDLRQAWRNLSHAPAFTAVVVLILAGGIGAATAIFSVVNAVLLQPLPYREADRLAFVWQDLTSAGHPRAPLSGPELNDLRERARLFTGFGGIWANTVALTDGDEPEQLRVGLVTSNFFDVLGAEAQIGRTFEAADERQDGDGAILLGHELWKRRYGGDPSLVGRRILVNGEPTTVLGVMPEGFRLLLPPDSAIPDDQQAWLLLWRGFERGPRTQQFLRVVARLAPGVSLDEGQEEVATIARQVGREFVEYRSDGLTLYAVRLHADATRAMRPALLALLAGVTLLLTIGCVNVAGLLVTRAAARHGETALRLAIGAGRGRLFRQCLAEGLLLSLAGGIAGVLAAHWMLSALLMMRPATLARIDVTVLDARVLAGAIAVSIAWGVLFSLAPMAQIFRINVAALLHGGSRGTAGGQGYRVRAGLVITQVAITTVLLVTASLLARGFYERQRLHAGFDDTDVLTFKLSLSGTGYRTPDKVSAFRRLLDERLAALPEVVGVGATSHLPYDTVPNWGTPYRPEGAGDTVQAGLADARAVTPGYFEGIRAEIVEGRAFSDADSATSLPVCIIDDVFASRMWPGQRAVGKRLQADPGTTGTPQVTVTVVGVVRHLRHRETAGALREQMYFPAAQSYRNPMAYAVRASDPASVAPAVRRALQQIDRTLPIYDVRPLTAYTAAARATHRFTLVLAVAFAAAALVLAVVGLYGVTAFAAGERRREFGVRFALGARAAQVAALVFKDALLLAGGGVVAGCGAAMLLARLLRTQIAGLGADGPLAYVAGAALVLAAGLLASAVPASRAARTDPIQSLSK
jgi:predicted permease